MTAVRETDTVPKKTTPRVPGPDDWASARIRHERELLGWSTAELARRVTSTGVPMRQQQVWQIESGDPPRKLSVGEAAAFAAVFGLTIADLVAPPEEVASRNLLELGRAFAEWRRDAGLLAGRLGEIDERVGQLHSGEEERLTADSVAKYGGTGSMAEQTATELGEIAEMYASIARTVKDHSSVWSLIASMRELVTDEQQPTNPEAGDIA